MKQSERMILDSFNMHWHDRVEVYVREDGSIGLLVTSENILRCKTEQAAAEFPAADARRLRDWLRERYPETDTGETK